MSLGTTTTTTTTTTAQANDCNEDDPKKSRPLTSTCYMCTACNLNFQDGVEQRQHMKGNWQNIRRRIASLPPISLEDFNVQTKDTQFSKKRSNINTADDESTSSGEESASPFQCLFCDREFAPDDNGFASNIEHMRAVHGLSIPDSESVSDLQSFVGYLSTEVRVWHECLYCGATKDSTPGVQSHMRDKAHCLLNFEREPELLDFWQSPPSLVETGVSFTEQEHSVSVSETELRLLSGKIIGSKHSAAEARKSSHKRRLPSKTEALVRVSEPQNTESSAAPPVAETPLQLNTQLTPRQSLSLVGISVQQRQAILTAEKKAQRSEAVAERAREWVYARGANSQKFDQLDNQRKWGKQNHKLLPR